MRGYNPFNKWKLGWKPLDAAPRNPGGGNLTPANHKQPGAEFRPYSKPSHAPAQVGSPSASMRVAKGEPVALPSNLYTPPSGESFQLSRTFTVPAFTHVPMAILTYDTPQQVMAQLLDYEIETDGPGLTLFTPTVNGVRVYPQHGSPSAGFVLAYPTSGNPSGAQLPLKPGDRFQWFVQNFDVVPHDVTVRSSGFLISNQPYEDTRFGG